jgi:hypothetical protein
VQAEADSGEGQDCEMALLSESRSPRRFDDPSVIAGRRATHLTYVARRVWPQGRAKLAGSLAAPAAAAGVDVGASGEYHSVCPLPPDGVLDLDAESAALVSHSLRIGAQALRAFAADQSPMLWPEHFDVGVSVDGANYGVSARDSYHHRPYAYIGPPHRTDRSAVERTLWRVAVTGRRRRHRRR